MKFLFLFFLFLSTSTEAVSIFPNKITVSGKVGTKSNLQIKIYGHFETANIEFVKVIDLKKDEDKLITQFVLGKEQERIIPIDIVIRENTQYYLCAVLKDSKSMRLRTCSIVSVRASS